MHGERIALKDRCIALANGRQAYFEALRRIRAMVRPDDPSRKVRLPDTISAVEELVLRESDLQSTLAEAEAELARSKHREYLLECAFSELKRDNVEQRALLRQALEALKKAQPLLSHRYPLDTHTAVNNTYCTADKPRGCTLCAVRAVLDSPEARKAMGE